MWEERPHSYSLPLQTSRKQPTEQSLQSHYIETEKNTEEELYLFALGQVHRKSESFTCELLVEGVSLQMEVDTGAEVSVTTDEPSSSYFQTSHP